MNLSVNQRARALATFRYVEVRLMEIVASWTPTTPEMEVKVVFGKHIWDFAQHADWIGKRTFELRQPEHYTLAPAEGYGSLLAQLGSVSATTERLGMLYDFFLPALVRRYAGYLGRTDALLDGPTVVIVERIVREHERQIAEGAQLKRVAGIDGSFDAALASSEPSLEMVVEVAQ